MIGWVLVGAVVAAYDGYAIATGKSTMSSVYRRTFRRYPMPVAGGTAALIVHLVVGD